MTEKRDFADIVYENRFKIIAAVLILIAAVLGIGLYKHSTAKKAEKASLLYSKGIEKLIESERKKNPDLKKEALKLFEQAERLHAGRISILAEFMAGKILFEKDKEKGLQKMKEAIEKMESKSLLKNAFIPATRDQKAIENALSAESPFLEAYLRYSLAEMLIEKKKFQKAKEELKQLIGKFPDSPFTPEARKLLEVLP